VAAHRVDGDGPAGTAGAAARDTAVVAAENGPGDGTSGRGPCGELTASEWHHNFS
jgi:hypothetical protein